MKHLGIGLLSLLSLCVGLLGLSFASDAYAQTTPGTVLRNPEFRTECAGSPCTGTAPTLSTDGRTLVNGSGVKVRLCADDGQTLSGGGTLDVYAYDEDDGEWALVPSLEITIPASLAGIKCAFVLEDRETTVPFGRVAVIPNAVTLSGGNLNVKIYVTVKKAP